MSDGLKRFKRPLAPFRPVYFFAREMWAWAASSPTPTPAPSRLLASLKELDPSPDGPVANDPDAPIFLFAVGWRTGSTLLQRILSTDPSILMWGEPYGEMGIISHFTEMFSRVTPKWPAKSWYVGSQSKSFDASTSWVANFYPSGRDLRIALRKMADAWMAEPARARGFGRWGFKEVRLGAADACLMRWLYPKSKFIVLLRHPWNGFRSARTSRYWRVYDRWPDRRVRAASGYGRHWNRLAMSWLDLPADFGHIVVKYEDVTQGRCDFRALEGRLGLKLDEKRALDAQVRGMERPRPDTIAWYERMAISRVARPGMKAYGYE